VLHQPEIQLSNIWSVHHVARRISVSRARDKSEGCGLIYIPVCLPPSGVSETPGTRFGL
jgi:hypothetical protein